MGAKISYAKDIATNLGISVENVSTNWLITWQILAGALIQSFVHFWILGKGIGELRSVIM